jgi:PhnB protein
MDDNPRSRHIRPGGRELTPYLSCDGAAEAIEFYTQVLDATETGERFVDADGRVGHAELTIGDSQIFLADVYQGYGMSPADLEVVPVSLHLYVPDVDATAARAEAAGATILEPPKDDFDGSRTCRLRDPFGHRWMLATHVREITAEEYRQAVDDFSETSLP